MLKMCLTDEDHAILRHVEEYHSITINQTKKMFYRYQTYGNQMAGRHLSKLVKYGKLKVTQDRDTGQNVYYASRALRTHDLMIMDVYASLIESGAEIFYFCTPQPWNSSKELISDAFVGFYLENRPYFRIVEIARYKGIEIEKYHKLYDFGEAQVICNDLFLRAGGQTTINVFPKLIVVDDVEHRNGYYDDEKIKIQQLDFKLNNFVKIFL
jgi:hypothetical protein